MPKLTSLIKASYTFGEGNSNPLQYFCLENSMDQGAWQATVHRVTQLSDWHTIYFYQTHSHNKHLKLTRLELTTERSYQTHSHNISLKIARLVRRFLSRRNMSLSKILCYMTKQSKKKKKKVLPSSLRAPDPFLLKGSRPPSPSRGPWPSYQPI